jgi:hypothetical protein
MCIIGPIVLKFWPANLMRQYCLWIPTELIISYTSSLGGKSIALTVPCVSSISIIRQAEKNMSL